MTLTKQLWLAVVAIMALAFGISLGVSAWSAKSYLEDQLRLKNQDNATSLALSMSQIDKDPVMIELLLSAQFDIGHYRQIRLVSPGGEVIVDRVSDAAIGKVPAWFVDLVPLASEPGIAQVQDGWRQYGTLTVVSHNGFAYQSLWQGQLRLLAWFLGGALLCGLVGTAILRSITRPLGEVVNQAEAIGARRFLTIGEPRTREFRSVVRAMNTLSTRVHTMLEEEAARLEQLRRDAQYDGLTGLLNREHFLKAIEPALADASAAPAGGLFILRLSDLAGLNKSLGHLATDAVLKRVADALQECCPDAGCLIGRLNGSDFALLVPDVDSVDALAQRIHAHALLAISDPNSAAGQAMLLGAADYRHGEPVSQVLSRADLALSRAGEAGGCAVESGATGEVWRPVASMADAWRSRIETALNQKRVQFTTYPVLDASGKLIHYEAPARLQDNGDTLTAQAFMPWASRLGLAEQIDKAVFDRALDWLEVNDGPLCINVSPQSVCDPVLGSRYYRALKGNRDLAKKLWLDIPEFVAYRHAREFRAFCDALRPLGCRIGLEHVGEQVGHIGELHDVGLDYLKIDRAIVRDIDQSPGNQTFLRGLCTIAHAMGMQNIAEGVQTPAEAACLKTLGFDGLTGPGVVLG
ncbi:MAG: LapD/MoxY N-terminal periplasmic domain-containing protein [Pseudomonadota bacterium]